MQDGNRHSGGVESPVTLEVIKGALRAAQAEMAALLDRTAMSPFIREKKDYFIGFFDERGGLIHAAGLPLMGNIIKPVLDRFPLETMRPGDIYWYNDCYGSKGAVSHTPDQVIIAPLFVDGRVRAFSQSWAHFNDIGGLRPGTLSPDADNIFQEGTIVPPIRLWVEGRENDDAVAIFVANSRYPEMVRGDLRALIAAVRLGVRRIGELFDRYGEATVLWALGQSRRQSGDLTSRRVRELLKPGHYSFTDKVDTDGQGNGPFDVSFDLDVRADGHLALDASRSSDQAPGPINFLMPSTVPGMTLGLYAVRNDPTLLVNDAIVNAVDEIVLRPGSVLQPKYPAPLGLRGSTFVKVQQAILGIVNTATDGAAPAASNAYSLYYMRGSTPDGTPFLLTDGVAVGYGARPTADGIDAVYFVAQENYPVEFIEMGFPIRICSYGLNIDTGGPGRWRGGTGVIREVEVLVDRVMCSVRIEGTINPPWGVSDGRAGRPGRIILNPGTPEEQNLPPIKDGIMLKKGDVLRMETGGGGGWGHPFDRPADMVLEDVMDGMVSLRAAREDYGVVIDESDWSIDASETEALRLRREPRQLFHFGSPRTFQDPNFRKDA